MVGIELKDLPPEVQNTLRKELGVSTRRTKFPKEDVRRYAIRALNVLAGLSQQERSRVLAHAVRLNEV